MGVALMMLLFVGIAAALVSAYHSRERRLRRAMHSAPRQNIADFNERETGKIIGNLAYLSEPFVAPLTGRKCAYYEVVVEEYVRGANDSSYWEQRIFEANGHPFLIEDGSGRAIVDPTIRETLINMDSHTKSGTFNDPSEVESAFLARHGKSGKGWFFNHTLRYKEGILEAGELVAVLGRGTLEPDPDGVSRAGGYRSGPPMRLRMRGTSQEPLRISDDPNVLS